MIRMGDGRQERSAFPGSFRRWIGLPVLAAAMLLGQAALADPAAEQDRAAIRQLEEGVARVLADEGFDAYADLFHADYSNWGDGGVARDRAAFLSDVQRWHAGGGHAVATHMAPLSIEVFGDLALSRYVLREDFNDGSAFVGRFVSLAKREHGAWLLFRTSYTTLYQGPAADAPVPTPALQATIGTDARRAE